MKNAFILATLFCTAIPICLAEDISRQTATGGCMLLIKQGLHDPDSASFGHSSEAEVILKANRAMVIRSVRAKNGFGALRLTRFVCLMELNNGKVKPAFVGEYGTEPQKVLGIVKKWRLLEPPKIATKK